MEWLIDLDKCFFVLVLSVPLGHETCILTVFVPHRRFDQTVKGLENEYQDARLEEWNRVSQPIEQWLHSQEQTLQSLQESPDDLNSLYKQQETTEVS